MNEDTTERAVSRRRLLALAGCGGDAGTAPATPTDTTTSGRTTVWETTEATTAATTETTTDGTETTTETTEEQTTEEPDQLNPRVLERTIEGDVLGSSSGAAFAPTDGFATPSWLDGDVSVAVVTNLDASGEGSLRWATEREGPCIVVFEVGGVIDLAGEHLKPESDRCWIAGQTAPSPGITLIHDGYPNLEKSERRFDVPEDALGDWFTQHTRAVELENAAPPTA